MLCPLQTLMCTVGFIWGVCGTELCSRQVVNVSNRTGFLSNRGWVSSVNSTSIPLPLPSAVPRKVNSGWCHTLLLLDSGEVYVASSDSITQMHSAETQPFPEELASHSPHSTHPSHQQQQRLQDISSSSTWQPIHLVQRQKQNPFLLQPSHPVPVVQMSTGDQHCLLLDQSGRVWAFGCNSNGQLGCEAPTSAATSTVTAAAPADGQLLTTTVAADALASDVTNAESTCQAASSASCQAVLMLGPGSDSSCQEQIAQVAAGACHSVAITAVMGRLYTWGWSAHGQCGTGSTTDVKQPSLCTALDGVPLVAAAAGMAHTLVVSNDGAVYSFGWNSNGQLGLGNCQDNQSNAGSQQQRQHLLSSLVPLLVEDCLLDQEHVVQVACGSRHSVVLTATGKVYTWGFNKYSQCCVDKAEQTSSSNAVGTATASEPELCQSAQTVLPYTPMAQSQLDVYTPHLVELPQRVELPGDWLTPNQLHSTSSAVKHPPGQQLPEAMKPSGVRSFIGGSAIDIQAQGWKTLIVMQLHE